MFFWPLLRTILDLLPNIKIAVFFFSYRRYRGLFTVNRLTVWAARRGLSSSLGGKKDLYSIKIFAETPLVNEDRDIPPDGISNFSVPFKKGCLSIS
jgi:hypothetical protein